MFSTFECVALASYVNYNVTYYGYHCIVMVYAGFSSTLKLNIAIHQDFYIFKTLVDLYINSGISIILFT